VREGKGREGKGREGKPSPLAVLPPPWCEMKNPTFIADVRSKLGVPSIEAAESLRLLRSFMRLSFRQRREIIELVERSPAPEHPVA